MKEFVSYRKTDKKRKRERNTHTHTQLFTQILSKALLCKLWKFLIVFTFITKRLDGNQTRECTFAQYRQAF